LVVFAVILAGGLGTRLRSVVSDRPKPMADVQGKPFLDYLVRRLLSNDVETIIICVSYMKENIVTYFENYGKKVQFSIEKTPLGTGGAIALAAKLLPASSNSLVLNGDTFLPVDYSEIEKFHIQNDADMTIVLARSSNPEFAGVVIDGTNRIIEFGNSNVHSGLVNAGVYMVNRRMLDLLEPDKEFSLEKDFLPEFVRDGKVYGFVSDKMFVDIGTPQSYLALLENGDILKK
jgi:D-glycero-alpha-D-manno-heptose 1-phosphate guanylyltransferase